MKKLRVGILFGGRSGEHEVSLLSAASVLNAIDKNKYEVVPIGITREGHWLTAGAAENLLLGKAAGEGARPTQSQLRAGDPEATPGRCYPCHWRSRGGSARAATKGRINRRVPNGCQLWGAEPSGLRPCHQCGRYLPCAARHLWRRWNYSRVVGIGGPGIRWGRRTGLGGGHG